MGRGAEGVSGSQFSLTERNRGSQYDACELEGDTSRGAAHRPIEATLLLKFSNRYLPPATYVAVSTPQKREKSTLLSAHVCPRVYLFHSHPHFLPPRPTSTPLQTLLPHLSNYSFQRDLAGGEG